MRREQEWCTALPVFAPVDAAEARAGIQRVADLALRPRRRVERNTSAPRLHLPKRKAHKRKCVRALGVFLCGREGQDNRSGLGALPGWQWGARTFQCSLAVMSRDPLPSVNRGASRVSAWAGANNDTRKVKTLWTLERGRWITEVGGRIYWEHGSRLYAMRPCSSHVE